MADQTVPLRVAPPAHVPAGHIVDFDYMAPEGIEDSEGGGDIYTALLRLHGEGLPDILWSPRHGGHWIVTRTDDIGWVREEAVIFSHEEFILPRGSMNTLMPPTNVDPPYHARFRAVLNPAFTPKKIAAVTEGTRAIAAELIDGLLPKGGCEFVDDFARILPVIVFLKMLELKTDRRDEFVAWAIDYVHARDQATRERAAAAVTGFLREVLAEREANPGDDLFSRIAAFRRNPRYQSEEEVMGMAMNAFIGGLDTTTSLMAFTMRHLATHPAARRRLVDDPAIIPRAAEEYIRRHALAVGGRLIKADMERKGVTMKAGELLLVVDPLAGLDDRVWDDPLTVDFDRDTSGHETFGNGVHRCVGEHLARMELIVFIEEWLKHIPEVRIDPALPPKTYGGVVIGMSQLGLRWD